MVLYDLEYNEIQRWNFFRAFPCRWVGPKLDCMMRDTLAVERIEIAHEGLELDDAYASDSSGDSFWSKFADGVQAGLDIAGLVPGVGEIADGVNALISLGRGDVAGATLSATSMLPIVGDAIGKGGKVVRAAIKHGDEVLEVAGKSVDGIVSRGNKVDTGSKILKNAKDAKKLDGNSEANKFAKEKGYKDAHELKKDYVGKDNISKYDIYRNNKTGESFLINKTGTSIVPVD